MAPHSVPRVVRGRLLGHSSDHGLETEQASDIASVALDLVEAALAGSTSSR